MAQHRGRMRETHKWENDIGAGSAVRADGDAILDRHADELGAGELAPLIGVEDVRRGASIQNSDCSTQPGNKDSGKAVRNTRRFSISPPNYWLTNF